MLQRLASRVLSPIVVGVACNDHVASVKTVDSDAMQPTLDRETVVIDRGFLRRRPWNRYDVVVVRSPSDRHRTLVARLLHFEGEYTRVRGASGFFHLVQVPRGHCWIQVDNLDVDAYDSRTYGPVPMALVEGRVAAVLWPPSKARLLDPPVS